MARVADANARALARMAAGITPARVSRMVRARFDAAQTTDLNRRHWANADALSADAAASPSVRATLRNRARYEVANNSYARGITLTLANDLVGRGPRLQMLTDDRRLNELVEREFSGWSRAVRLGEKLRTMRLARACDGEAFAVLFTNRGLHSPVHLDLRLVEADQVTTPPSATGYMAEPNAVDGIEFDADGNPTVYHVLREHPGGTSAPATLVGSADRYPASGVLHWFRADRPGQRRGLPDILPALPLFALLRRFTLATVSAAEIAAEMAVIMRTTGAAAIDAAEVDPSVVMDWERGMMTFSPEGWEPYQLKPEHPATTFAEFVRAIIREVARCLNVPYAVAAGDSSEHNYASGRLDWQVYYKALDVDRCDAEREVIDRVLEAWLAEAVTVGAYGMFAAMARSDWPHQWFWDGREHVDPAKEATAQEKRLRNRSTTLAYEYGRRGLDWETQVDQSVREEAHIAERRKAAGLAPRADNETDADDETDDDLADRVEELEHASSR